ncbi:transglutaminase family protein [Luteococcus peritonei]|uniref:Transglutaminase family protein n=1 Tax=Luteococcus peritonei TaxID=88874 RepID=A0ABW4RXP6_9ACTN
MNTRHVRIGAYYRYSSTMPTAAVFQIQAQDTDRARISDERLEWDGPDEPHTYTDSQGNRCLRVTLPAGISQLTWSALAAVPDELDEYDETARLALPADLPDEVLAFTLPSRFCESDKLSDQAWRRFGQLPADATRVMAIMDFVHTHLIYTTGSTTSVTSALDVYTTGRGVCRDFAHLMIAMCRAMNIPARYAFGYMPHMDFDPPAVPMDFHAWVQVWVGGRWYDFDPRHNFRRKGRILVGTGRDAADAALVTTYGGPWMQQMTVTADEVDPA